MSTITELAPDPRYLDSCFVFQDSLAGKSEGRIESADSGGSRGYSRNYAPFNPLPVMGLARQASRWRPRIRPPPNCLVAIPSDKNVEAYLKLTPATKKTLYYTTPPVQKLARTCVYFFYPYSIWDDQKPIQDENTRIGSPVAGEWFARFACATIIGLKLTITTIVPVD